MRRGLTQPVASNILRSRGSPERRPSRVVSEWQAAMAATNGELATWGSRRSSPAGRKLGREREQPLTPVPIAADVAGQPRAASSAWEANRMFRGGQD